MDLKSLPYSRKSVIFVITLLILFIVVFIFLTYDSSIGPSHNISSEKDVEITKDIHLTKEQVQEEREKLVKNTNFNRKDAPYNTSINNAIVTQQGTRTFLTQAEVNELYQNEPDIPEGENTLGIDFGEATIVDVSDLESERINLELTGIVIEIGADNSYITIASESMLYEVTLNTNTRFMLNNGLINIDDIVTSDTITVKGMSSVGSRSITASEVHLVGVYDETFFVN